MIDYIKIKENICNEVESCDKCRELFKMPYGECCLFACDYNRAVCKKCDQGIYSNNFNQFEKHTKVINDLCKGMPYCIKCKKTFNMPHQSLCCLFDCGKYEECEKCCGGIYSEKFKQ